LTRKKAPRLLIPAEWTFKDGKIAAGFDRHVREQLPWYDLATTAVAHIARHYVPQGGRVYDLGASTGNIGRALQPTLTSRNAVFVPIEESEEMCAKYSGPGTVLCQDICTVPFQPFDLGVAFLTLMFIPVARRCHLLDALRSLLRPGGALIIFDKTNPAPGYTAAITWRLTLAAKLAAGADPAEVLAKELSLAGIQRPLSPSELPGAVEVFRFGDFCGWVIEAGS
jgi:tRNA (cmo5U34)-methyltransferase